MGIPIWLSTAFAIIKFIMTELPDFLEQWGKVKKDKKYGTQKQKRAIAQYAYNKNPSAAKMKKLEEAQK